MDEGICTCGHRVAGHYSSGRCAVIKCACIRGEPTPENVDQFRQEYAEAMHLAPEPVEDTGQVWKIVLGDLTFDVGRLRVNHNETNERVRDLRRYVETLERRIETQSHMARLRLDGFDGRLTGLRNEAMTSIGIIVDDLGDSLVAVTADVRHLAGNISCIIEEWPNVKKKRKAKKRKR